MVQVVHIGFHNCLNRGGYDEIRRRIPFMSRSGPKQWLTQGYYFWTDDPYWAHKWNVGRDTVISEFTITFDSKDELLDLVGNAKDIMEFETMRKRVASTLTRMSALHVTVNQVISFFRDLERSPDYQGVFPYAAVKAQDSTKASNLISMGFVDDRPEEMVSYTRQQMCVYEHARGKIEFKRFIFPADFCEKD